MDLWERQKGEGAQAFAAFRKFRDLGASRSLDSAYRDGSVGRGKRGRPRTGRAPGCWGRWYRDHHWASRAAAYDAHCDAIAREARERRIAELATRRLDFELSHQERLESLVCSLYTLLQRAFELPLVDSYTKPRKAGSKPVKIKGLPWAGAEKMAARLQALAVDAILGVRRFDKEAASSDPEKPAETPATPHFNLEQLSALSDHELTGITAAARRLRDVIGSGSATAAPE